MSLVVDLWHKDGRMKVHELLVLVNGCHPRIIVYHGHDPVTFERLLQHFPKASLPWHDYLQQLPEVPFQNSLTGAIEIAQGIVHLHSKDDLYVVLYGFGGSYANPDRPQHFDTVTFAIYMPQRLLRSQ